MLAAFNIRTVEALGSWKHYQVCCSRTGYAAGACLADLSPS
jgi:hypothetical protein